MTAGKNPYKILGVSRNTTQDQIKKAYRDLARKHHPDMNKGDKRSEEKFKEIQHAYETLSDPEKKKNYDTFGTTGFGRQGPGSNHARYARGFPGIDEIFKDIFSQGAAAGSHGSRGSRIHFENMFDFGQTQRRENVAHPITLDFRIAIEGGEKELLIGHPGNATKKIKVRIPAGVKTGSKIRVPAEKTRSYAGDIILDVKVSPHPVFRRENDDIYLDLPLTVYEAALGTQVDVPTIESPVKLTVPSGVMTGTKMRLKEKGVRNPRTGKRGDQFVILQVTMPEELDKDLKTLMSEIRERHPYDPRKKLASYL